MAWLATQQQADGGFEVAGFPGFETSDAVLAIGAHAQTGTAWNKTEARKAVRNTQTGGKNPLNSLDDWVDGGITGAQAAKAILFAVAPLDLNAWDFDPDGDTPDPVNLVAMMNAALQTDGSYGTFVGTAYAVLAREALSRSAVPASLSYLESTQQPNGSWNFAGDPGMTGVDVDTTGVAVHALLAGGMTPDDPAVRAGLTLLADEQLADGGWGADFGVGPEHNAASTSQAIIAIEAAGWDVDDRGWRDTLAPGRSGQPYTSPTAAIAAEQATDGHIASPFDGWGLNTITTTQSVQALHRHWFPLVRAGQSDPGTPPTTPPTTEDSVAIGIRGNVSYTGGGTLNSGNLDIASDLFGVSSVTGTGTYPSPGGGDAAVSFSVSRIFVLPIHFGAITVKDPGAGTFVTAQIWFAGVSGNGSVAASSSGWLDLSRLPWGFNTVSWKVNDRA